MAKRQCGAIETISDVEGWNVYIWAGVEYECAFVAIARNTDEARAVVKEQMENDGGTFDLTDVAREPETYPIGKEPIATWYWLR